MSEARQSTHQGASGQGSQHEPSGQSHGQHPQQNQNQQQQQRQGDPSGVDLVNIDETIGRVERLYERVTGRQAPAGERVYAPIPAERDPAEHVEECMDRLLLALGQTSPAEVLAAEWTPPLTVWESDREVLLCLDLPGVQREQVEVTTRANELVITGSRPAPTAGGAFQLRSAERPLGRFRRTVLLPAGTRGEPPAARLRDGVLEIRLQKENYTQEKGPQRVRVE